MNSSTNTASAATAAPTRSRSTPPRRIAGIASTGSASTTANSSRFAAVSPDTTPRRRQARLDEHAVLERAAHRAAAGGDLGQRVAGQLRRDHRLPARARAATASWSAHMQNSVAAWSAAIVASQAGDSRSICRHEPSAAITLGATR